MKPRKEALTIPPGSHRYWVIANPDRGEHWFRHPPYGAVGPLLALAKLYYQDPATDKRSITEKTIDNLPFYGAVLGSCWYHRAFELVTPFPGGVLQNDVLIAYGDAVIEELQEADYNLFEITELFGLVLPEVTARQNILRMAGEKASFTKPPKADLITS